MNSIHLTNEQIGSMWDYQTIEAIGDAWREILRQHLGEPGLALDAGCGQGFAAILLAQMGWQVIAADHSDRALKSARENARKFHVEDRITFRKCDITETGLPSGSLDAVVVRHTSYFLLKPFTAYQEWFRLLKAGGTFLNFDANWLAPLWDEARAQAFLRDEQALKQRYPDYTDMYHDRYALMRLSQYPLAYRDRPRWDLGACRDIGYSFVDSLDLSAEELLPEALGMRFKSIPGYLIKAIK